jgi:hypothetical protein
MTWSSQRTGLPAADWRLLQRVSCANPEAFWSALLAELGVKFAVPPARMLQEAAPEDPDRWGAAWPRGQMGRRLPHGLRGARVGRRRRQQQLPPPRQTRTSRLPPTTPQLCVAAGRAAQHRGRGPQLPPRAQGRARGAVGGRGAAAGRAGRVARRAAQALPPRRVVRRGALQAGCAGASFQAQQKGAAPAALRATDIRVLQAPAAECHAPCCALPTLLPRTRDRARHQHAHDRRVCGDLPRHRAGGLQVGVGRRSSGSGQGQLRRPCRSEPRRPRSPPLAPQSGRTPRPRQPPPQHSNPPPPYPHPTPPHPPLQRRVHR